MKIIKSLKGTYGFSFHTGRLVPLVSDPTRTRQEKIERKGFSTKKEAEDTFISLKIKYSKGAVNSKMNIATFTKDWFPMHCRNSTQGKELRKRTADVYKDILNKHLLPYFGNISVSELEPLDVERFIDHQLSKGLTKQSIKHHYRLLSLVADALVRRGFLPTNVVKLVNCPQPAKKTKSELKLSVLDHEQQKTLLAQAKFEAENSTHQELFRKLQYPLIYVGLGTGVRLSEALGFKWKDIIEVEGHQMIQVNRSVDIDATLGGVKSGAAYRDIPLSPELYQILMAHKKYLKELQLASLSWEDNDLIFPSREGSIWDGKNMSHQIRNIFDRAGVPGSFHTLRHTCITNWLHTVQSMKLVSTLAGHSAISITLDRYGHILESNTLSQIDNLYATMRLITK